MIATAPVCQGCREGEFAPFAITMAFQPIIDVKRGAVWGYEALVRGADGRSAGEILSQVDEANRYAFDQACRVKAIELAGALLPRDGAARLSINFMPNAVYNPATCIRSSLEAAGRVGLDPRRIMFEFTENERVESRHVEAILAEYKRLGFTTAIDDFGSGYAGLNLLANFQPDVVKIDMGLIRDIHRSPARQVIIMGVAAMAHALDVTLIAEGIETEAELMMLRAAGIHLFQGYLFAKPAIEVLPAVPDLRLSSHAA